MSKVIVSTVMGTVENIQELLPKEFAKVEVLKAEGVLEHLYVKDGSAGAVLVFNGLALDEVKARMESFPLYPHFKTIDYVVVEQNF